MNRTLLRRGLRAAAALGIAAGTLVGLAPQSGAEIAPPGVNHIAAAGSDTTEVFMEAYLAGKTSASDGVTTWNIATYNIPALGGTKTVTGDADCPNGTITYGPAVNSSTGVGSQYTSTSATTFPLPNGSSAGRRFLVDQRITNPDAACVDIARSSSAPPFTGETSSFQYYAFALDAVTWGTQSLYAPSTLTAAQIDGIYNCTFTNWNQVGGLDMPIQRVMAQAGSGTRSFFMQTFGITDAELNATANGCAPTIQVGIQENDGRVIPNNVYDNAILPYSAGRWAQQASNRGNPTIDIRDGVRLGGQTLPGDTARLLPVEYISDDSVFQLDTVTNGTRPATVVEQNIALSGFGFNPATGFLGVRYLFNVIDSNSPSFNVSRALVGFDNSPSGFKSVLCNTGTSNVSSFGFARLPATNTPNDSNLALSRCRRFLGTGV